MISKTVRNVCEADKIHLIENYELAKNDSFEMWECHHRLEIQEDGTELSSKQLKELGKYWKRPPEELIFLRRKEHRRLHHTSRLGRKAHKNNVDNRKPKTINWVEMFRGKTKEEIAIEIEHLDATTQLKSSLRQRFIHSTPKAYTIKPKPKKVRTCHDWAKELAGKTEQECEEIINNTEMNGSQRSRLRKKYCPNFKRCETGSSEWYDRWVKGWERRRLTHPPKTYERKGCEFSRKYSGLTKDELMKIVLDDNTSPAVRKNICDKLLKVDYLDFNTKTKRLKKKIAL